MAELVREVLALHNTLHTDRSQTETLKTERNRLAQRQDALTKQCQQLEKEVARLQQMLASRNSALSEELGLQSAYNQCLTELFGKQCSPNTYITTCTVQLSVQLGPEILMPAEANAKVEQMSSETERTTSDMYQKLRHSEAQQMHLSSMLSVEKQAHAAAMASLQQSQQMHTQEMQELNEQVGSALIMPCADAAKHVQQLLQLLQLQYIMCAAGTSLYLCNMLYLIIL